MAKLVSRWRPSLVTQPLDILPPTPLQVKTNTMVPMVLKMALNKDIKDLANVDVIELGLQLTKPG